MPHSPSLRRHITPYARLRVPAPALTGTAAACALALLAACGGGDAKAAKDDAGRTVIRVTYPTNVSNVPLHIALKKGYFKASGLTVKPEADLGSGSTVEAVVGGQVDMAWANSVGGLTAYSKGIDVRLVAVTDTATHGNQQVLVPRASKARDLADLKGEKLAVLAPTTVCILNVRAELTARGLPTDAIEFTPVSPPEHANVLSSGEVAATCTSEPFRTQMIQKLGARSVFDTDTGELKGYPVGGYLVTSAFAKAHPKEISAFRTALNKATRYANTHPDEVRKLLPTFTGTDADVAADVVINRYLERQDTATVRPLVRRIASAMHSYGLAERPIDVSGYFAAGR
ncbi:Putative aliphatic sulfonates-binding protein precursor (plasmid) [Streptomyces sp. YIM 121038]|uniref:ABC transporter substrate-binding protein n=1 Tax=Streptomyces sp. YIM 121038 TaxID=2136401 RepID=UPI001110559C|nr:ABC transporter substrate-binding protein [Streptomyces sp. YIM 121038]QCX82752.1 Putative aliphatic sulfonates-binding protein precursor [Streptomyces sp. YIM 121038]